MSLCGHQPVDYMNDEHTKGETDTTETLPSTNVGDASRAQNDAATPGRSFITKHHDLLAISNMHVQCSQCFGSSFMEYYYYDTTVLRLRYKYA